MCRLLDDTLISQQKICIREFARLKHFGINPITKAPITNEHRIFLYKDRVLAKGFYWSDFYEDIKEEVDKVVVPQDFIQRLIRLMAGRVDFWVADVAEKEDGEWILVEINDACMSGLSTINPNEFYKRLGEEVV